MKKNSTKAVSPKANPRLKWVIGFMVLIYLALVFALAKAWYADQMVESFHFFNDLPEWKQLDKFAHALWAFHICAIATRLLKWGSLDQPIAMGAIIGFLFVSSIEILDGFSAGYGASLFDLAANALGAALFFVQMKIWNRIHIFPKFSFHFTTFAALRPSLLGDGFFQEILKDYNGQTFWYSWSPDKKWWPSLLSLAVGIGAEGMIYGRDGQNEAHQFSPYRKLLFSLDLNSNYLSSKKGWLRAVAYPFTVVKFPAPAIEISVQGIRFHWLHF